MLILIVLAIAFISVVWLLVEFIMIGNLNEFLDKKILRRFLWVWLPLYALWRLSKEVFYKKGK